MRRAAGMAGHDIVEAAGTVLENMFKELLESLDSVPDLYRNFGFSIPRGGFRRSGSSAITT